MYQWIQVVFSCLFQPCHYLENAWLPEREKRCRVFQESLRTDAVLQVRLYQLDWNVQITVLKLCALIWHEILFVLFCFLIASVLDLNAFERQNKAEGLGMVTEEGSSKYASSSICCFLWSWVHFLLSTKKKNAKVLIFIDFFELANAEPWRLSHSSVKSEKPGKIHSWILLPCEHFAAWTAVSWVTNGVSVLSLSCLAVMREACVGFTCKCMFALLTAAGRIEKSLV